MLFVWWNMLSQLEISLLHSIGNLCLHRLRFDCGRCFYASLSITREIRSRNSSYCCYVTLYLVRSMHICSYSLYAQSNVAFVRSPKTFRVYRSQVSTNYTVRPATTTRTKVLILIFLWKLYQLKCINKASCYCHTQFCY